MGLALVLSSDDSKTLRAKQKSLTIHSNKGLTFVTTKDLNVSPTQIYTPIKLCKTGAQQLCTAMCTEGTAKHKSCKCYYVWHCHLKVLPTAFFLTT